MKTADFRKSLMLVAAVLALPAFAYQTWTGSGGDNLFSNPLNWKEGAVPEDPSEVIFLFNDSIVEGSVLTNDLSVGPYKRITVPATKRSFTIAGQPMGLRTGIDNSASGIPLVHRYALPVVIYGNQTSIKADPNTMQVFDGPISVVPTNVSSTAYVRFVGAGTNVINGGFLSTPDCYSGNKYGTDKTTFSGGTTIIASDFNAPSIYMGDNAHVIVSNATLHAGCADNIDFIRTCTIDLMKGGRYVPQKASVMLAQGGAQYTTRINVLDGGFLDFGLSAFRPADDGRFELTIEDGGLVNWGCDIGFSAAGGSVVTINGGRLVSSYTSGASNRFRFGYEKSQNAGITFENALVLNGGELLCAGIHYRSYDGLPANRGVQMSFNGGALVALYDAASFNACGSNIKFAQVNATVQKGGFVFDTHGHNVTWNDVVLRGQEGGDGGLVKRGSGVLTLAAEGTYTGTNRVEAGSLAVNAANASACLSVASGADATVGDAAYFAQAVRLEPGAVFGFGGTSLSLSRLDVDRGVLRFALAAADAGQRLAVGALAVDGALRVRLTDDSGADWTANGTYTLLTQTGLDASVAALCRIDNPIAGKSYSFAAADDALRVTVVDGADEKLLVVTENRVIDDPLEVAEMLRIRIALGATLTLSGGVTGGTDARIFVTGPGTLAIAGGCAVPVVAEGACVSITSAADLAAGVTLGAGATLHAAEDVVYAGAVHVDGPAQLTAAADKTFVLNGTLAGEGSLATGGEGKVSVADASTLGGGLVIGGVTVCETLPDGDVVFNGGTLLYAGTADAALAARLCIPAPTSPYDGCIELAPEAGDLDVTGPFDFTTSLSFLFRTAEDNEMTFRGSAWFWGGDTHNRLIRLGRGNFRFASDCLMRFAGGGASSLQVGDSSLGADEARPTELTIDEGAYVSSRGMTLAAAPDPVSGCDVSIVQNGGRVELTDAFSWGAWGTRFCLMSYTVNGGSFKLDDASWMNFWYGDTLFDVKGGDVSLGSVSFGWMLNSETGCHQESRRSAGFKNIFRVSDGAVAVNGNFNWMGDVDYNRRRAFVEVADDGTLTLPATQRAKKAPDSVAGISTVLRQDGGLLRLSGVLNSGTSYDDYLQGLDDWTVGAKGGAIETPAEDVTIRQRLRATSAEGGDFVKTGAGGLTLAAEENVVFGAVDVREGSLTAKFDATAQKAYPDSLVALWTFDGDDPLADKTGHGHDLVQLHGENYPVAFTNGDETIGLAHAGNCAYWPVCGGSLAATNAVAFNWNAHTVSFWAKMKSFSQSKGLICFLSTRSKVRGEGYASLNNNNWCICLKGSGSNLHFDGEPDIYPGVCAADTARLFTLGEWHMITSVRDGTNVWEYIDGQRVDIEPLGGNVKTIPGSTNIKIANSIFSIGQTYGGFDTGNEYISAGAMMDDIAVFSRALTAEEVAALYGQSLHVPTPAVKVAKGATWNMNGGSLSTPLLEGAGSVLNGSLAITDAIRLDATAETPLHVANPVFPSGDVTVDLGHALDSPVRSGRLTVLTYDTLDEASAAQVTGWKVTGTGRTKEVSAVFSVDTERKAVVVDIASLRTIIILR